MVIYDAVAWFDRPVSGRQRLSTRDDRQEFVAAVTPEAAALKWLWRLSEAERRYTVRIVLFAPKRSGALPVYAGPPIRFVKSGGKLAPVAPTAAEP